MPQIKNKRKHPYSKRKKIRDQLWHARVKTTCIKEEHYHSMNKSLRM